LVRFSVFEWLYSKLIANDEKGNQGVNTKLQTSAVFKHHQRYREDTSLDQEYDME
jgi:hypothetical protein